MNVTEPFQSNGEDLPLSGTERAVAALWSEVLGIPGTPRSSDDFFGLGGDSMSMVMLEFRVTEEFSVELSTGAVLDAPTLRDFSALIDRARASSSGDDIASET